MEKMSVTRALSKLSTLDKKINSAIKNVVLIGSKQVISKKVLTKGVDEFIEDTTSNYKSIRDLIKFRADLKGKIATSNAKTEVVIGGVTYTVAEAIERKTSISYETNLLEVMTRQYRESSVDVVDANGDVEDNLERQLLSLGGADKDKTKNYGEFIKGYREQNQYELVDPLGLEKKIEELRLYLFDFTENVDVVLSESNSVTFIEI